ncbi:MAG: hypothetical protein H6Q73_2127 [Firmicutes bacterium]|nr:hypothetical protein [Bacillota bacterium]
MCKTCGCPTDQKPQLQFFLKGVNNENLKATERYLLGLPGIYHVHIHVHDGQTTIAYNPLHFSPANITEILAERGLYAVI